MKIVKYMNIAKYLRLLYVTIIAASLVASIAGAQNAGASISSSLCIVIGAVETVIGILALMLFVIGGTMYAAAHLLPAAGNLRGNLQGWSMGMLVGGIVGLILVLIAGPLLGLVAQVGGASSAVPTSGCGLP